MEPATAIDLARQMLMTALTMAAPLLAGVLLVSLTLAIVTTVLNLQEQTLTIVPKIITALVLTGLLAPWLLQSLLDFTVVLLRDVLPQRM